MTQDAPLFILAPPRSFTSVICGMVGQHPQMYGLPEVNLFAADDYVGLSERVYRLRPGFRHGLLRAIAELGLGGQTVENIETAQTWLDEHSHTPGGDIFLDLAEWAAPRRLVDKSPIYVYAPDALERLVETCPDAYYLHLTRHPRPTCESVYALREKVQTALGRAGGGRGAARGNNKLAEVDDPESLWLKPHLRVMEFLEDVPEARKLRLRGEDFMADPDTYLPLVCEWLGISSSSESIEAMKHPENSPFACMGPMNARFGNDPSFLESPGLREYKPKPQSLSGPLQGTDGATLSEDIVEWAGHLGYS